MPITQLQNGQQLVSNLLSSKDMDNLFQKVVCLSLGIMYQPIQVTFSLTQNSQLATTGNTSLLYPALDLTGPGLPVNTKIEIAEVIDAQTVRLSSTMPTTGTFLLQVVDDDAFWKSRIGWLKDGQPGFSITDDVCFVTSEMVDHYYGSIRDVVVKGTTSTTLYTVPWRIHFTFYGPKGYDHANAVRSTMLLDYVHDFLAASNIYLNPDTKVPRRNPEKYAQQWFERTDLFLEFNEFVTETITVGTGTSVEVIIATPTNPVAKDFTISGGN